MAQATGAHSAYDEAVGTGGNREDLSDIVWDASPAETPLLSAMKKTKATGINHGWVQDSTAAGAQNANIEGNDASPGTYADRVRFENYTQIQVDHAVVTGTQEKVLKAGVKSEMAHQVGKRMVEQKKDIETAIIGLSNPKVAGDDSTAREMGSLDTYLANGVAGDEFAAATSDNPTGDGTDAPNKGGTDRALSDTILNACLENLYTNSSGTNIMCVVPAKQKSVISTFTASSTRYVTTDDKKLVASIDVYDGDFHTVKIVPSRQCIAGSAFLVDPEYLALAELRPMAASDLATLGDSLRKQIVWEGTLEVCDPNAHTHIFDLS